MILLQSNDGTEVKIFVDELDDQGDRTVLSQVRETIEHDSVVGPVRIMPDCHVGMGCVIGFTAPLKTNPLEVIPSLVGVDVGCGMLACCVGKVEDKKLLQRTLDEINKNIRNEIPLGFDRFENKRYTFGKSLCNKAQEKKEKLEDEVQHRLIVDPNDEYDEDYIESLLERADRTIDYIEEQIGTLGGGNHFIELALDTKDHLWIVVHTGSRSIGHNTAKYWVDKAEELRQSSWDQYYQKSVSEIKEQFRGEEIGRRIEQLKQKKPSFSSDLVALKGHEATKYLVDMCFLQSYAERNRYDIVFHVLDKCFPSKLFRHFQQSSVREDVDTFIESVHNFIDFDDHMIRKGATPARNGQYAVVPLNMKDGSLIVRGKGNDDWNQSVCHGAGRVMSRREAKETILEKSVQKQMEGVVTSNIPLDEAPDAYKESSMIREAIKPTAEIVEHLTPILNVKA